MINISSLTHKELLALPNPVRLDLIDMESHLGHLLGADLTLIKVPACNKSFPYFQVLREANAFKRFRIIAERLGPGISLSLARMRHIAHGRREYLVSQQVLSRLVDNNGPRLSLKVSPDNVETVFYMSISPERPLDLSAGANPLEGAYVFNSFITAEPGLNCPDTPEMCSYTGQRLRVIDVILCGSPLGGKNIGDDRAAPWTFYLDKDSSPDTLLNQCGSVTDDVGLNHVAALRLVLKCMVHLSELPQKLVSQPAAHELLPAKIAGLSYSNYIKVRRQLSKKRNLVVVSQ
ncbi:MAG: hypothetical protein ACYDC8_17450 [Gammaproteobacteria bacterium]